MKNLYTYFKYDLRCIYVDIHYAHKVAAKGASGGMVKVIY